jgi:tripartite-type tricarboxylate transporter receptor subunit TctC
MDTRVKAILTFFVAVGSMVTAGSTASQSYPNKPIRLIAPFETGGATDISVRNLASQLGSQLGQQVVVDNRPGASGIIGTEMIARVAPDGYVFGYLAAPFATNPSIYAKLPYDSARDFQPIILFSSAQSLLAVTPTLSIRSVKELIEYARAKPDTLSFGSGAPGTISFLSVELFKSMTATRIVSVSYKGPQQAITDVIGGQIHLVCDFMSSILPQVQSGRVRALGVTSMKRSPMVPEVPTLNEAGVLGYEVTGWGGYALPARAPRAIVLRLNAEINKALLSPSVSRSITERGSTPIGGTPEQFVEHIRTETERWGKVIKAAGIKPQ